MEGREDVGLVLAPLQLVLLGTHPLERRTTATSNAIIGTMDENSILFNNQGWGSYFFIGTKLLLQLLSCEELQFR